ncbi:uncharacterized protein LOC131258227 isoform X2 [Magnolia sinica]|uniref:uncharacterized protein LOC131258227 isoform X2 n=1 Tax=Magnolia sinica TaxID=86752 RepID=UPI00265987AB|nr:uncharacterized protein LOC131258227 isoform X2 [Magnolia sinica]
MEEDAQNMETTISCAMRARIRDFKDQAHYLTLRRVRRSLEKDMGLKKFTLDAHKSFIKQCLHEELISGACRLLEGVEEQPVRLKKQAVKKVAARNTKGWKKRKRSTQERKPCSNQKNKPVKLAIEKGSNTDEGGNSFEEGKSQSSAEEPVKKKRETSTQVYGKRVEHLKSIIKACGMSIPPSVYKRAKQAPKNKREARLIKELEEILGKEGLSSNPFEKEIKEAKKRKERGKELADIDMSNIVSSSRRRSTSNFIIPPPKPRLAAEKNDGGGGDEEEDTDDEESESEGASEDIKDVKEQKKRAKLGIDMSNIVSSSHRKSTSNFIIPPPKSRLAIEKNDGVGGGDDDDDDDEEDTDDEESESEGACEEIKETKKRKERGKELADIDMSNIVSSSHRRSTSNFIIPPPKPRLAVEKNDGGGGSGDEEEDTNDEESESEEIKDVKKQKKREKLGIDMSNIVSSSHRKSTSNFITPPPKSRLAIEKNDGVGGGGGGDDDDDEEYTDDEESESKGACEGILLHVGASSTSAQGSNTRKQVEFNQVGQPVGENAASFSTFLGQLTRTYCPIRYVDWRSIPAAVKDNIWSMIRDTYEIDVKYRSKVLQKVNKSLRNWKWELRKHYDRFDQDAERKRNCPKGVKQEEWDSFVDVESMEQSISRRENGKASRKEMKRPHTTGRRGAARTAEKMQKENPNTIITRTDLYVATHTRSDGSYPTQELSTTMEKIKSIIASDPASTQRDLDHDPVAQVCGRDSRGIIRGMGEGISKTTIMASIPYMEEAQTERRARMSVESRMEAAMAEMLKRLDEEKAFRMSVEQQLADIRQQIARQGQQADCSPTQSHLRPTIDPVMPGVFKKTRSQFHKQKKFAI